MPGSTIELPEDVRRLADIRAAESGYAHVEEYLSDLIVADAGEPISEELEAHLLKAMESPGRVMTQADWEEKARQLLNRHEGRGK